MKELIWVRAQYALRQQCCKTHKRPLPFSFFGRVLLVFWTQPKDYFESNSKEVNHIWLYNLSLIMMCVCVCVRKRA